MQIAPNTLIHVLQFVPLDNTYKNTIYFEDKAKQANYFAGKKKRTFSNYTYQRLDSYIRVEEKADVLYTCNYLMFQNTAYGNKWFYAFITKVEYVNDNASNIYFEIDVMQTWMFDKVMQKSFVVREHSVTDEIGENIVTEPVNIGDIQCDGSADTKFFNSYSAVIATAYDPDETPGGVYGGLFSGVKYIPALLDSTSQINNLLDFIKTATDANVVDSIISIFIMPTDFIPSGEAPVVQVAKVGKPKDINGYTPRNNKLLTAPYCYLACDCGNATANYRYEWFRTDDDTCQFSMNSALTPNPEITLVPVDYNHTEMNYSEKLVMTGFPQVAFAIDSYRAYLAQGASADFISLAGASAGLGASIATGNTPGTVMSALGVASSVNNIMVNSSRPPHARGSAGGTVDVATRTKNFIFRFMSVQKEYAQIIDDFFDMYGYATNRLKFPNTHSRPHWNYVQTQGCNITGSFPTDDIAKMKSIFDNGITFWKNGDEIGNYSLDNKPTG